jgi:hypothetical protein
MTAALLEPRSTTNSLADQRMLLMAFFAVS